MCCGGSPLAMRRMLNVASYARTLACTQALASHSGLTNVAADGRDQVVGLCMFRADRPQLNSWRR
jgi:hypothetical protein